MFVSRAKLAEMNIYVMRDLVAAGEIEVDVFQHWMNSSKIGPYEILELMASAIVGNQLNIGALINMHVREHGVVVNLDRLKEAIYYSEFRMDCKRREAAWGTDMMCEPVDYERISSDRYDWVNNCVTKTKFN